jgi:mono/diheme cytochrome c family protein
LTTRPVQRNVGLVTFAKALVLTGLLLGTAAAQEPSDKWIAPAEEADRPNPVPASAENLKRGRSLFQQHCATCHGDKGRGDGPYARLHARRSKPPRDLTLRQTQARLTDGEIFWKMSTGLRQVDKIIMPAFFDDIRSPEDRWRIVLYVRVLGRDAGPQ